VRHLSLQDGSSGGSLGDPSLLQLSSTTNIFQLRILTVGSWDTSQLRLFWHEFHSGGAGEAAHLGLVCGFCASVDSGRCVLVAGYTRGGWEGMERGLGDGQEGSEEDETNMRDER